MADNPGYAATPNCGAAVVATGDTSRTAPNSANTPVIFTAGAYGGRIERISGAAVGNTSGTMLRHWLYDPSGGGHWYLLEEIPIVAVTVSNSQEGAHYSREAVTTPEKMPLLLKPGWQLRASIHDTQAGGGICVTAIGGDF